MQLSFEVAIIKIKRSNETNRCGGVVGLAIGLMKLSDIVSAENLFLH